MKNNIDWYPHYVTSDEHPKFKALRVKYGWEGEGKFWRLNNRIAGADGCHINLTKKYNKAGLADDLQFTLDELDEFLKYLEKDCRLIIKKNNYITTKRVKEALERVMQERKRNKKNYKKSGKQDNSKGSKHSQHVEKKIQHVEKKIQHVENTQIKRDDIEEEVNINTHNQDHDFKTEANFNLFYLKSPFNKADMKPEKNPNFVKTMLRVDKSIGLEGLDKVIEKCNASKAKDKTPGYYLTAINNACDKIIEIKLEGKHAPESSGKKTQTDRVPTSTFKKFGKRPNWSAETKAKAKADIEAMGS